MNEQEIIFSLIETIRANEINDDERLTIGYLRNILYTYRAEVIKNTYELSEDNYQSYELNFQKKGSNIFISNGMPDIIYDNQRIGISIIDYDGTELPVVSKEEAINSQKSRFINPPYVAYITNGSLTINANIDRIAQLPTGNGVLLTKLNTENKIVINCILAKPLQGIGYDWETSPFPLNASLLSKVKQNILRREFGVSLEVKKDEIQNAKADNIIYQDESKLYK